jgi:LEA14-like dessication related protein
MTTKKAMVIGGVTLLAGAMIYFIVQYRKLMQYVMNYKGIKVKQLNANNIAFDLSIEFVNKSSLAFRLMTQRYQVYVNDKFVSKGGTDKPVVVQPKGSTILTNLVSFNPTNVLKALEKNFTTILLQPESVVIRIDYQINTTLWGISIPIKNTYRISLKEIRDLKGK